MVYLKLCAPRSELSDLTPNTCELVLWLKKQCQMSCSQPAVWFIQEKYKIITNNYIKKNIISITIQII